MSLLSIFGFGKTRSQTEELVDSVCNRIGASVRSASIKEENRTVQCVATTETPVPMWDFERHEVVDEILVASGGSFPERMPLLDTHDRSSVSKVLGSAINPIRSGNEWEMTMEFDDDEPSETAFKKVRKKHVRDVSIGYEVLAREWVAPGETKVIGGREYTAGTRWLKVSTKWAGSELSLAPLGADRQAKIRSLLTHFQKEKTSNEKM